MKLEHNKVSPAGSDTGVNLDGFFPGVYTAGGTADALTIALSPAVSVLAEGIQFMFRPSAANTGSATIDFGPEAVTLKLPDASTNLPAGYLQTSNVYGVWYDGTNAVIVSAPDIIESGNNANGYYVRYSGGTQECWHTLAAATTSGATGNVFFAVAGSWTFPKAFISATGLVVNNTAGTGSGETWGGRTLSVTATGVGDVRGMGASSANTFTAQLRAIGRWYL